MNGCKMRCYRVGVLAVCAVLALSACKRRRPIELEDDPAAASTNDAKEGRTERARRAAQGSGMDLAPTAAKPVPPVTTLAKPALLDVEPDKAPKATFGFPMPAGMQLLSRSSKNEVYETSYSVPALEKFFRRELGRDGELERRTYGFIAKRHDSNGFAMITHPPGAETVRVAVIGPVLRRVRLTDPHSETPGEPPAPVADPPAPSTNPGAP